MKKNEFLSIIRKKLEQLNYNDTESVIEYYDELIEEKIELGKKETQIIKDLGSIDDIIKGIKIENKLDIAYREPTIKNGANAVIAVLGFMSLPILIPFIILAVALMFTGIVLLLSAILVIGSLILTSIVLMIALFISLFNGDLPLASFLLASGVILIISALGIELIKVITRLTKDAISGTANYLKKKLNKRKEVK